MNDAQTQSLIRLLNAAQAAEEDALARLWQRFYPRMIRFADERLKRLGVPPSAADGEEVAASALRSFLKAVQNDRFRNLQDESDILRFLFKITVWKAIDRKRKQKVPPDDSLATDIDWLADDEAAPDVCLMLEEEVERLIGLLGDAQLQRMALLRLDGYDNTEIKEQCRCSLATVERRFRRIREILTEALGPAGEG